MKYITTRNKEKRYSFEDVLFMGYAPGGGLAMPETIPKITAEEMKSWSSLSFLDLSDRVLEKFIDKTEIPDHHRRDILEAAFRGFDSGDIVPLVKIKKKLHIAELHHGKTRAFKDIAMSVVGQLMQYFLFKSGKKTTILVGTSGDTGGAAISAVAGLGNIDIIVLYPLGRVTEPQELQLTTYPEHNVHVFAVHGTSDDLDEPIKQCFSDDDYVNRHSLCSINSINCVRILMQTIPYIYCYFRCCEEVGNSVYFQVPTGAAGSLAGSVMVYKMGFPISVVPCVNSNDIMHRTLQTGMFKISGEVCKTYASAMDIQAPYNIERLLYFSCEGDTSQVKSLMDEFEEGRGGMVIPKHIYDEMRKVLVDSCCVHDGEILQTMRRCWSENKYIMCPHTATAVTYYYKNLDSGVESDHCVCMATASAAKFPDVLKTAGLPRIPDPILDELIFNRKRYQEMKKEYNWLEMLQRKIEMITNNRKR